MAQRHDVSSVACVDASRQMLGKARMRPSLAGRIRNVVVIDRRDRASNTQGPWVKSMPNPFLTEVGVHHFDAFRIGHRPLLMLGTLMIVGGIQIVIFGLLAEMIASTTYQPRQVLNLVRAVVRHEDRRESD